MNSRCINKILLLPLDNVKRLWYYCFKSITEFTSYIVRRK